MLHNSIYASRYRVLVFFLLLSMCVVTLASAAFVAEYGKPNFQSVPQAMYWGIVTIATVGFGDVTPSTPAGKFIASVTIMIGYAVIALPTGIVSVELSNQPKVETDTNKSMFFVKNGTNGEEEIDTNIDTKPAEDDMQRSNAMRSLKCIFCPYENRTGARFCACCGQRTHSSLPERVSNVYEPSQLALIHQASK